MAKLLKLRRSFEKKVLAGFVAAACVVALMAAATFKLASDAKEAARLVSHTYQVVQTITEVRADTLQIEFSTQSYRISGDPTALRDRNDKLAAREKAMTQLQTLISDSPAQLDRWQRLRVLLDERIAISKQVERLRSTEGVETATAFVATAPLRETRDKTYAVLQALDQDARAVLELRTADQLSTQRVLASIGAAVALFLVAILSATYVLIRRQLMESEATQRALIESEASLSTTLRSLGDAVLRCDTSGRVTHMNPVAERLTGWSVEDARGLPADTVLRLIGKDGERRETFPAEKVLATNHRYEETEEISLVARDGHLLPVGANAAPIVNEVGEPQGVVLVFRDITIERQAKQLVRNQNLELEHRVQERTQQLEETQGHLQSILRSVPLMVAYIDAERRYVYANGQYRMRFAPMREDIAGETVQQVLGALRYAAAAPVIDRALAGAAQSYDWQPDPGLWLSINLIPKHSPGGDVAGYYVLGTDISARKLSENKIHQLNAELEQRVHDLERVTRAWKTLSAGNSAMLRASDEEHLLQSMCDAIANAGGYPIAMVWYAMDDEEKSLVTMAESGYGPGMEVLRSLRVTWAEGELGSGAIATCVREKSTQVVHDMQSDPSYKPWRSFLLGNASCIACPLLVGGKAIGALSIYAKEPATFGPDEVRLLTESADDLAFGIASLRAKAERARAEEEMHRFIRVDALTGLPNEVHFIEAVNRTIEEARSFGRAQPFAVLQLNIARLREINEALGLANGDQLLKEFGVRLSMEVTHTGHIARLGGDEFGLLVVPGDENAATGMVHRIQSLLQRPFEIAGILLDVSVRAGVALYPAHGATPDALLQHADFACNQAKRKDLGFKIYDPTRMETHPDRLAMASELRRAIDGGDLQLYLQPKIDMASGEVLGAEALVRWQHVSRGLVSPGEFIELAEHTGLIKTLTDWVIESAMRICHEAQERGNPLPIAVNLSAKNLRDEGLPRKVKLLHESWGVKRGLLEFEITESTVMEDPEFALRVLHELRREGISLYIDDFGTGYSSLSYLLKLPVEYVKIDQSFVRDMASNIDSAIIVKSTVDLAHALGRKVVAEGVETRRDWDMLSEIGCDIAQGYFVARPMPSGAFYTWCSEFRETLWPSLSASEANLRRIAR